MKNKKMISWLLKFTIIFVFSTTCVAEETIRITTGEWPPLISEGLRHNGAAPHIVKEAFALEGIKVEYGFFPWARAYDLAKEGDWDASIIWIRLAEREQHFHYSDTVFLGEEVFFHLKSNPFDWKTIDDFEGITIGATTGDGGMGEKFLAAEKAGKIIVERVPSNDASFRKLLAERIDVVALNKDVGYFLVNTLFMPEEAKLVTHHPKPASSNTNHLIFSKKLPKNERLRMAFNRGLKKLREAGKINQFLNDFRAGKYLNK